jgi:macrolide-specific efflux system membrane fusion protein
MVRLIDRHRYLTVLAIVGVASGALLLHSVRERSAGTTTDPLKKGEIVEAVYGIGTVMANRSFQLKPGVISTINELFMQEGDYVEKNDKIARVDHILFHAPFSGTITSLPFKVGENVFSQVPILSLVDLSDRYLLVSLEQQGALRVKKGQTAHLSFDTAREQTHAGSIQAVYSNESAFLARISVAHLPQNILPGMTCDVAISIQTHPSALLIPIAAIEEGKFVWVKRGSAIPQRVEIKTGIIDKAMAEVTSGSVTEGDRLIIRKNGAS